MMRITIDPESIPITLRLEGELSGPWVAELQRVWQQLKDERPKERMRVEMTGVTFIDSGGKELLAAMFVDGADLQSRQLLTGFILNGIKTGRNAQV